MVEDSRTDLFLIREAIRNAGINADVDVVHDGRAATQYIDACATEEGRRPDVILLDLNLPKKSGAEVLKHLRTRARCEAKVLIVSSSDAARDRDAVEVLGVSDYFKKPASYAEFMKLGPMVKALLESEPGVGG